MSAPARHPGTELLTALVNDRVTPEDLRDRLATYGREDPEHAHSIEDHLLREVLRTIALRGGPDAVLARDALVVVAADYPRWRS